MSSTGLEQTYGLKENRGVIILEPDDRTIIIKNLWMQNEDIYHFLDEVEDDKRVERLMSAVRIGVVGLRRMDIGEDVDYIEKEFNAMVSRFEKMFDPSIENSHLGKLVKLLGEYFDKGGTVENMLDPTMEGAPLGKLRHEILEEIKDLRDAITKKKAKEEVVDVTTLKGYEFEDACEEILSDFICKNIGDELERKTQEVGEISRSFAGDYVVTLRDMPNKKIVLEIKDWDSITQPQIIENLEKAMKNRGAKYGIFVSKYKETLPKKIGWFNEFRGNMLVCALGSKKANTYFPEMLNIAYQWARLRLKKEIRLEEKAIETLAEGIAQIEEKLEVFSKIQRQCTNVDKATGEIRELSEAVKNDIAEQVKKIQRAISSLSEEGKETSYGGGDE